MKLRFGTAKHGWLPAELEGGGESFAFAISYLPNDFLFELVEALINLMNGSGQWQACLPQEPVEVEWRRGGPADLFSPVAKRQDVFSTGWQGQ